MISEKLDNDLANLKQQAHQYLIQGNYAQAASCFEQAIAIEANNKSNYWHLGLIFLLQQQEEEAQMTWLLGVADGEPEEIELWTEELVEVLAKEADRQLTTQNGSVAWVIRQHIREINPNDINILLRLIYVFIALKNYREEQLREYGIILLL